MVVKQAFCLIILVLLRVCVGCKFIDGLWRTINSLSRLKGSVDGKGSVVIPSLLSLGATGVNENGDKAVMDVDDDVELLE